MALPDLVDDWADPTKGHVAGVCWYLFAKKRFNPFNGLTMIGSTKLDPIARIQAENYDTFANSVKKVNRDLDYEGDSMHIAEGVVPGQPDSEEHSAEYRFRIHDTLSDAKIVIRYSDHVGGDECHLYLDGEQVHMFNTISTGGWSDFTMTTSVDIGQVSNCEHVWYIRCDNNGTFGLSIDMFDIRQ